MATAAETAQIIDLVVTHMARCRRFGHHGVDPNISNRRRQGASPKEPIDENRSRLEFDQAQKLSTPLLHIEHPRSEQRLTAGTRRFASSLAGWAI